MSSRVHLRQSKARFEVCESPSAAPATLPPFSFSTTTVTHAETDCDFVDRRRRVTVHLKGVRYYGYRYYTPGLGRWINRDPIRDKILYVYVNNAPVISADYLGLFGFDKTWGKWSIGASAYRVWGFDFGCSFEKDSEDCCDDDGNLIENGLKSEEIDCKLEIGIGVGGEIRFMKEGWKNPKIISSVVKGPQVYGEIKRNFESAYCGGPLDDDGKACTQIGIDAGASASFGYLIFSASVDAGVRGYVEVCIDTDGNWEAEACVETHLGIDVSVGIGPASKKLISERNDVGPGCVSIGDGVITP